MSLLDEGVRAESVAEIDRELTRLRRMANEAAPEDSRVIARTAVLNLFVYATRRVHAERASRTIASLAERHPCRAVVIYHDESGRHEVEAEVSMRCRVSRIGKTQLCYEQIVVQIRRLVGNRLRSVVIPLLIPDLPAFVWWTGTPPADASHFTELAGLADRLLVDSADFARPEAVLPTLLELVRGRRGSFGVTDLNWTRLTVWRELVAQFFDVPEWRPFLDRVTGLRVGFAVDADGRSIHPSQALLLVGWLASRLGWSVEDHLAPSEAGGLLFRLARQDGTPLWVRVRPRFMLGMDEGGMTGLRILSDLDGRHAEFVIKRAEDGSAHAATEVLVDEEVVRQRTVLLPVPGVMELLGEELTITGSDHVYEEALATLCALI